MQRWDSRVAVITGASCVTGQACAEVMVRCGMSVVALARRVERLDEIREKLCSCKGQYIPKRCDVTQEEEIVKTFEEIEAEIGPVDIMINNSNCLEPGSLIDDPIEGLRQMMNVNFIAHVICAREAIKSMRSRCVEDGLIININSMAGHNNPPKDALEAGYYASKHAALIAANGLKNELVAQGSKLRIVNLCPLTVSSEMGKSLCCDRADSKKHGIPCLFPEDVGSVLKYVLSVPAHVEVLDISFRNVEDKTD